ncbi:MAG: DEAD/DEAH box helicase [Hydrogenophilales bacterium]|nr:DEAD/DEAH box helicase [Hydrogenophilales bacterium]
MSTEIHFAGLGLAQPLLRAITDAGYTVPTPIQAQAIPLVLAGGDLLAAAQTGTGKTAGFTLPILHRLSTQPLENMRPGRPRCLILVPTRELAAQVEASVKKYGKHLSLTSMVMFGGVNINPQYKALKGRVDILVATPGRLLDHVGQKTVDLSGVEILVLDEADRMLDMGFIRDIRKILALLPKQRQNLLFSATFSDEIKTLADGLLHNPGLVEVARRNAASELVEQSVYLVAQDHKRDFLAHLIKQGDWKQVLVFTRTKHGANRLAEKLVKDGIPAAAIHGNKSQAARTRALAQFKDGVMPVLVATDIAARGLDIDQLPHVVNFELPNISEDYVHRIGRTGRAGSSGAAISLVDREEIKFLNAIERLLKREIPRLSIEGFVPPVRTEPEAPRPPRQHRQPPRQGAPKSRSGGPRSGAPRSDVSRSGPAQARSGAAKKPHADRSPQRPHRAAEPAQSTEGMSEAARHQMMADNQLRANKMAETLRHQTKQKPALFTAKSHTRGR